MYNMDENRPVNKGTGLRWGEICFYKLSDKIRLKKNILHGSNELKETELHV